MCDFENFEIWYINFQVLVVWYFKWANWLKKS